jgi:hypothetical protein
MLANFRRPLADTAKKSGVPAGMNPPYAPFNPLHPGGTLGRYYGFHPMIINNDRKDILGSQMSQGFDGCLFGFIQFLTRHGS